MTVRYITGIDPGLVDTGIVRMRFSERAQHITVTPYVVSNANVAEIVREAKDTPILTKPHDIFIEAYRPRRTLNTDKRMVNLVHDISKGLGPRARVLPNTGIKKVVRPALLETLGIDKFVTRTHHADLESAGRILVLGMLKDPELNQLLANIVKHKILGQPWLVDII